MKLWLLQPATGLDLIGNPWDPWYDKAFGFVVRAKTEADARALANKEAGYENRGLGNAWIDPKYSTCVELKYKGEAGIVIRDFASA